MADPFDGEVEPSIIYLRDMVAMMWYQQNDYLYDAYKEHVTNFDIANLDIQI